MNDNPRPNKKTIDLKDPFADLSNLEVTGTESFGVTKALLHVPVKKPNRQEWFRVDPRDEYRMATSILELKNDHEIFLVMPEMRHALLGETKAVRLFTAYTRPGDVFLIPVALPDDGGALNTWAQSRLQACELAMTSWVRCAANMSMSRYDVFTASGDIPEPELRTEPFNELLRLAFQDKCIDTESHPVVKHLLGLS